MGVYSYGVVDTEWSTRCFNCGELGHFANTCLKKKDKGFSESKAATAKDDGSDDDVFMSAHEPQKCGDMDL